MVELVELYDTNLLLLSVSVDLDVQSRRMAYRQKIKLQNHHVLRLANLPEMQGLSNVSIHKHDAILLRNQNKKYN